MPVNPYDDRKVSLRRPHGNGDLDIVRASYTRRKANVTEALMTSGYIRYFREQLYNTTMSQVLWRLLEFYMVALQIEVVGTFSFGPRQVISNNVAV